MNKYYFINNFDTNIIDKQDSKTIIIYRNYTLKKIDEVLILKIKNYCKKKLLKFYISNEVKLAIKLNLDGVYIPSFNKNYSHLSFSIKKNFKIIGSAHNLKEIKIKNYCKKKLLKFYISNEVKLAIKLNLDGVYIPSFNKNFSHLSFSYKKNFEIIGSAHNLKEIKVKELQNVKKIFLSSLFKKNKNYLGINKFKLLSNLTETKIVSLGGISNNNLKKLKLLNNSDFAGISYFE